MDTKKKFGILIFALTFLLVEPALGSGASLDLQPFQLHPRANLWGFTGDYTRVEGQMLMPIYGNQAQAV